MGKLSMLLAVSMLLAYLYEYTYIPTLRGPKKPEIFYVFLVMILICFSGFRGAYNDTWNYRDAYTYLASGFPEAWDTLSWSLGENPAFNLIQAWFKTYDADIHLFLMFFSFWTVLLYMAFLRKYSTRLVLTIYFFFTMGCYTFTMAAIKQCMAIAICLAAIPFSLEKKWIRFALLIGIAALFHPYALMYLIVPFMTFRPWRTETCILLLAIIAGGLLYQPLLGTVVNITTAIGEEYTENTLSGQGINILRLGISWAPVILSLIYRKVLFTDSSKEENLFINLSMASAGIMFVGLFGTALYFNRLSYYFLIMQATSLPWMLIKIKRCYPRDGRFLMMFTMLCYFAYFYYSNAVDISFSASYEALSLSGFLRILFDALKGGSLWSKYFF